MILTKIKKHFNPNGVLIFLFYIGSLGSSWVSLVSPLGFVCIIFLNNKNFMNLLLI